MFRVSQNELQQEEGSQHIHAHSHLLIVPGEQIYEYITQMSKRNTVRNAVTQRHEQNADKCGDRLLIVM